MQCWRRLRLECAEASSDKVSLLCDHLPRIYLSNLSNCQPLSLSLSLSISISILAAIGARALVVAGRVGHKSREPESVVI